MHPATDLGPGDSPAGTLVVRRLGRRSYDDGVALQARAARRVAAGGADELLYVDHPPIITLGRGTTAGQLRVGPAQLAAAGITLHQSERGGGATYHGPGQLIGYPIVDLRRRGLGVRAYLRALEGALVAALHDAGVAAHLRPGLTGVWTPGGKLAAIGVAVRRGITRHGFAINDVVDPTAFDPIVPCGLHEPVTSLARLGSTGQTAWLQQRIASRLRSVLDAASPPFAGAAGASSTRPGAVVSASRRGAVGGGVPG